MYWLNVQPLIDYILMSIGAICEFWRHSSMEDFRTLRLKTTNAQFDRYTIHTSNAILPMVFFLLLFSSLNSNTKLLIGIWSILECFHIISIYVWFAFESLQVCMRARVRVCVFIRTTKYWFDMFYKSLISTHTCHAMPCHAVQFGKK